MGQISEDTTRGTAGYSGESQPKYRNLLIALLLGGLVFTYGVIKTEHSWDTVPYVALLLSLDGLPDAELHESTYAALKAQLTSSEYTTLVSGTPRRKMVAENPEELLAILPFWEIKPLYLWLAYGAYELGLDPVTATTIISTASASILAILLVLWISRYSTVVNGLMAALLIAILGGIFHLTGLARPDGLSALLIFACFFALIEYRAVVLTGILTSLAVLARPDNSILVGLLLLYLAFALRGSDKRRRQTIGLAALAVAATCYFAVQKLSGAYGWKVTFYVSFLEPMSLSVLQNDAPLTALTYVKVLYWSILESWNTTAFAAFIFFNLSAAIAAIHLSGTKPLISHSLAILLSANVLHWLIFPSFELRFFSASYLLIGLFVFTSWIARDKFPSPHRHEPALGT